MEQKARRIQSTSVGAELVFENKPNRQAVAQIFRALKTKAGTGLHTGFHRESVHSIGACNVGVAVQVLNTSIDDTVELNVSGESGTGKSAENCNSSQSLFHFQIS